MSFIRVQHKGTKHKYDAPEGLVDLHLDQYIVLDATPVKAPRPVELHEPAEKKSRASKSKPVESGEAAAEEPTTTTPKE